ncbi:hypothetical protein AAMO2058_000457700 [Amorphochlora amoebiformis]
MKSVAFLANYIKDALQQNEKVAYYPVPEVCSTSSYGGLKGALRESKGQRRYIPQQGVAAFDASFDILNVGRYARPTLPNTIDDTFEFALLKHVHVQRVVTFSCSLLSRCLVNLSKSFLGELATTTKTSTMLHIQMSEAMIDEEMLLRKFKIKMGDNVEMIHPRGMEMPSSVFCVRPLSHENAKILLFITRLVHSCMN